MSREANLTRAQRMRLIRFAPIFTGLLVVVVWFSVPTPLWSALLGGSANANFASSAAPAQQTDATSLARDYYETLDLTRPELVQQDAKFSTAISRSWTAGLADQLKMFAASDTSTVVPLSLSGDSAALAPLQQFERETGARVFAWTLQPIAEPPLVASAIASTSLLLPETGPPTAGVDGQTHALWGTWHVAGLNEPINWMQVPGSLATIANGPQDITISVFFDGRSWWLAYVVAPHDTGSRPVDGAFPNELWPVRANDPSWTSNLMAVAQNRGVNIFVCGPINLAAVPLRLPKGASLAQASALGAAIWPNDARLFTRTGPSNISALSSREASMAAGQWATVRMYGVYSPGVSAFGESMMYAAVWNRLPISEGAQSPTGWRSVVLAVAPELTFILGLVLLLFIASIVASAVTFILGDTPSSPPGG